MNNKKELYKDYEKADSSKGSQKPFILSETVKERVKPPRERVFLKKMIFVEYALSYASLRDKLMKDLQVETTRQYLYGIVSGRLNPSYEFATKLCKVLGISNVWTLFDQSEIHLPIFHTADKLEEVKE